MELQNQLQGLKLELEERTRSLEETRREVDRLRFLLERTSAEARSPEELMQGLASPVQQLALQCALIQAEVAVRPQDLKAVAERLLQALDQAGLKLQGARGDTESYDPDRHQTVGEGLPRAGQPVVLKAPAVAYQGRILRKALVDLG